MRYLICFIFINLLSFNVLSGIIIGDSPFNYFNDRCLNSYFINENTNINVYGFYDVFGNVVGYTNTYTIYTSNIRHRYYGALMTNVLVVVNTNDLDSIRLLSVVSNYWIDDNIGFQVLQLAIPNSVRALNGKLVMGDNDQLKSRYGEVFHIGNSDSRVNTKTTAWEFVLSPISNYFKQHPEIRYIACLKGVPYLWYTGYTTLFDTKMRSLIKEWQFLISGIKVTPFREWHVNMGMYQNILVNLHTNVVDINYRNKIVEQIKLFDYPAPLMFWVDGITFEDASNLVARSSSIDLYSKPYTNWWNIDDGGAIFVDGLYNWFSFYTQYTNSYIPNVCYSSKDDNWRATNSPVIAYSGWGRYNVGNKWSDFSYVTNGKYNFEVKPGAIASIIESYTCESYVGYWFNQFMWLNKYACGGTNYDRTMCGFFGPVSEPYLGGQGNESIIYPRYFQGFSFVEAAWMGIQNHTHIVCGHPFMRLRP